MASSRLFSSASGVLLARGGGINAPPEVKATWPAPNYVNPEERGWGAPIALIVLLFLTILIYIGRIRGRFMVNNLGIDDVLMSVAMLPLIGLTVSTILGKNLFLFGMSHVLISCQVFGSMDFSGICGTKRRSLKSHIPM